MKTFQRIQAVENHVRLLHELAVIFQQFRKAAYHRIESCGFEPVELVIFKINVVDDLGDPA